MEFDNVNLQKWLEDVTSWQADDSAKCLSIQMQKLNSVGEMLNTLNNNLLIAGTVDVAIERWPLIGQFLGRLCSLVTLTHSPEVLGPLLNCLLFFFNSNPQTAVQKQATIWVTSLLQQLASSGLSLETARSLDQLGFTPGDLHLNLSLKTKSEHSVDQPESILSGLAPLYTRVCLWKDSPSYFDLDVIKTVNRAAEIEPWRQTTIGPLLESTLVQCCRDSVALSQRFLTLLDELAVHQPLLIYWYTWFNEKIHQLPCTESTCLPSAQMFDQSLLPVVAYLEASPAGDVSQLYNHLSALVHVTHQVAPTPGCSLRRVFLAHLRWFVVAAIVKHTQCVSLILSHLTGDHEEVLTDLCSSIIRSDTDMNEVMSTLASVSTNPLKLHLLEMLWLTSAVQSEEPATAFKLVNDQGHLSQLLVLLQDFWPSTLQHRLNIN